MLIPLIKVKDNIVSGVSEHIVGTNSHDRLLVSEGGGIQYLNMQCMEGTGYDGEYAFVTRTNPYDGMAEIEFVTIRELIEIAMKDLEAEADSRIMLRELLMIYENKVDEQQKRVADIPPDTGGGLIV